jgi:transcriptional regulator with XRE-family HTH domain
MTNNKLVPLGRVIARTRAEKRLTQAEVAKRAKTHRSHISRIERGHRDPRLDTLQRLADALDTKLGTLLSSAELAAKDPTNARRAPDAVGRRKGLPR